MENWEKVNCWGLQEGYKVFSSPKTHQIIKYLGTLSKEFYRKWHSDLTGRELFSLLQKEGAKPLMIEKAVKLF